MPGSIRKQRFFKRFNFDRLNVFFRIFDLILYYKFFKRLSYIVYNSKLSFISKFNWRVGVQDGVWPKIIEIGIGKFSISSFFIRFIKLSNSLNYLKTIFNRIHEELI